MKILAIETSCDETAISLLETKGALKSPQFKVISNITLSQAKIHQKYGGVFPNLAKREHSKNLIPVLKQVLKESRLLKKSSKQQIINKKIKTILEREPELLKKFAKFIPEIEKPPIDKIAVTYGPGLEPALWVGINFAKALSITWNKPLIPINHMEGHIASVLLNKNRSDIKFPALALLISGGHTELVLVKKWGDYKVLGRTRDDAVGEVFDKVARMLGLPYPGGPEVSRLAERARSEALVDKIKLPRPMKNSRDLDFSFSGLKTAVLYFIKGKRLTEKLKKELCLAFEEAVAQVLIHKTKNALEKTKAKSLIIAGGVSANKFLRDSFMKEFKKETKILIPAFELSTDNALMIALAAFVKIKTKGRLPKNIKAQGGLSL